jgi:hypothetical protein
MFDGRCLRACERRPLRHPLIEVSRAEAEHLKPQAVILLSLTNHSMPIRRAVATARALTG